MLISLKSYVQEMECGVTGEDQFVMDFQKHNQST